MKRIIEGEAYDTATATLICDTSNADEYPGPYERQVSDLYLTEFGDYFVAGSGGGGTAWEEVSCDENGMAETDFMGAKTGIILLTKDEAQEAAECYASADVIETFFT